MIVRILIIALLLPFAAGDGEKDGRRGNKLYEEEQYDLAVEAYYDGLAALGDASEPWVRYALLNNLGTALLKAGNAPAAREALDRALLSAPAPEDAARTHYNAGNAAFVEGDLQQALQQYRENLLRDPNNVDAKFNYEFVKRRLEEQQQNEQQQSGQNEQQNEQQDQEDSGGQEGNPQEQDQQDQDQSGEQQDRGGQDQPESESEEQQQEEQGPPEPNPDRLSHEQAQRILEALQNDEEQLLRQVQRQKSRPRQVEKDW